jgi:hypothetical protein
MLFVVLRPAGREPVGDDPEDGARDRQDEGESEPVHD